MPENTGRGPQTFSNGQRTAYPRESEASFSHRPGLGTPISGEAFPLICDSTHGEAIVVLTQKWEGKRQPGVYMSKLLDPVSRGWLECVQAIAATALLVERAGNSPLRETY